MFSLRFVAAILALAVLVSCGDPKGSAGYYPYAPEEESEGPRQVLCFDGYALSGVDESFLSDVTVSLQYVDLTPREVITGTDGYYQFRCSPGLSGTFVLRAQKEGWTSQEIRDISLRSDVQRFNFVLEPVGGR